MAADLGAADITVNLSNTNGTFNTNLTIDGIMTASSFSGAVTGNASTASALAADPSDCSSNQFANGIAANGNLACAALTDADIPNTITVNLAAAATALQSDPSDCSANQFATGIAASGNLSCAALTDADVPNNITVTLAASASALAADPSDCSANQFATGIAASGNLSCAALTDADVPNNITVTLAGAATALAADPTDCLANQFATTIAANGNLTCAAIAANNLPSAAADLGAANVTINLSNTNGAFVTNLITDGTITAGTFSGALSGNASTATVLAADPSDCSANQFATAIAASGNLTCAALRANNLPSAAADLGAANVTINLSNSNGSFNTNLTVDGVVTVGNGISVSNGLNNNSGGVTNAGSIAGVAGITFSSGALNLANGGITSTGSIANVSGISFTASGTFDQSASTGTFATGSGAVSLNGATSVTGSNTLSVGGLTTLNAGLNVTGASTFTGNIATSNGNVLVQQAAAGASVMIDNQAGKIGSLKSGTAKVAFFYDDSGSFSITRETRANILASNTAGTDTLTALGNGNVGIGDATPAATFVVGEGDLFQVAGATGNVNTQGTLNVTGASTLAAVSVTSLRIGTSATAGYVLTTDASGNATWQPQEIQAVYNGTTLTSGNNKIWTNSISCTTGACSAVLSTDGTTGGTAIFSTIYSVQCTAQGATGPTNTYYCAYASYTAGTKTLALRLTYAGGAAAAPSNVSGNVYITVIGN